MDDARAVGSPATPIAGNNHALQCRLRAVCAAAMISFALLLLVRGQAR